MPISREALEEIALTQLEYEQIVERLGREPNGASTAATNTPVLCWASYPANRPESW